MESNVWFAIHQKGDKEGIFIKHSQIKKSYSKLLVKMDRLFSVFLQDRSKSPLIT